MKSHAPAHAQPREFLAERSVRFGDCDPAGIVFYPRYFEMLNSVIEDWWQHIGLPWTTTMLERRLATPVSHVDTHFLRPSTMGETLSFRLSVEVVKRSSFTLDMRGLGPGSEQRLRVRQRMVCVSLDTKQPLPWPEDIRSAIAAWVRAT